MGQMLQQCQHVCVAGNHDLAATGGISTAEFNPDAAIAARWTGEQLTPGDKYYLDKLPLSIEMDEFTLVHGSPREPIWEYVVSANIASLNFSFFQSPYCLVGHSHVPVVFREEGGSISPQRLVDNVGLALGEHRLFINPGGVGQPRDGDPRASYAIYDSETSIFRLHRVPYDIKATQDKMMQRGLPVRLAVRLEHGM